MSLGVGRGSPEACPGHQEVCELLRAWLLNVQTSDLNVFKTLAGNTVNEQSQQGDKDTNPQVSLKAQ